MNQEIPTFIKPFLWSFDFTVLDLRAHKQRIITNVLNYGDRQATDWLRKTYSQEEIQEVLLHPLPGEWSKRSYNFWSLLYGVSAPLKPRVIFTKN